MNIRSLQIEQHYAIAEFLKQHSTKVQGKTLVEVAAVVLAETGIDASESSISRLAKMVGVKIGRRGGGKPK